MAFYWRMLVAAAICYKEVIVSLPRPKRHHEILRMMAKALAGEGEEFVPVRGETQGFITDTGHFLDRINAKQHAIECGQLDPKKMHSTILTSEDLW